MSVRPGQVQNDISLIGAGGDELCGGRAAVEEVFLRNFAEATAKKFEWHWSHVVMSKDCAVVATTLTIHLEHQGNDLKVLVRWTVGSTKHQDRWGWLHRHASPAAFGQDIGAAYPK